MVKLALVVLLLMSASLSGCLEEEGEIPEEEEGDVDGSFSLIEDGIFTCI